MSQELSEDDYQLGVSDLKNVNFNLYFDKIISEILQSGLYQMTYIYNYSFTRPENVTVLFAEVRFIRPLAHYK